MKCYDDILEKENLKIAMTSLQLHVDITKKFKDISNDEELKILYIGLLEAFQFTYNQSLKYIRGWAMKYINTQPLDVTTKIKILKMSLKGKIIPTIERSSNDYNEQTNIDIIDNVYNLNMINELCDKVSEFLQYTNTFLLKSEKK